MSGWFESLFEWIWEGKDAEADLAAFNTGAWVEMFGDKADMEDYLAECLDEGELLKRVYGKAFEALVNGEEEKWEAFRDATDDLNRVAFMECRGPMLEAIGEALGEWWMGFFE